MDIPLLRSPWVKLVIAAVALYAIWVLMLLALQRSMIFPGAGSSPGAPNESALSAAGIERWWLDTDDGKVEAWYAQSDQVSATQPGPAVIFAHGNAEDRELQILELENQNATQKRAEGAHVHCRQVFSANSLLPLNFNMVPTDGS